MTGEAWLWALALVVLGAVAYPFVGLAGGDVADAARLVAVAALLATAAHLTIGLTRRPVLALSLPLLAGWWATFLLPDAPAMGLFAAAGGGLVAGAALGLLAAGGLARCAALTLLVALLGDAISSTLALGVLDTVPITPPPLALAATLGGLALALGWWMQGTLFAALLDRAAAADEGAGAGVRATSLRTLAMALGGLVAGLAGALLAQLGTAPPGVELALVLAVAALAGGAGLLAGALALTGALWLLPEMLARTSLVGFDLDLVTLALAAVAMGVAVVTGALEEPERG